MNHLSKIRGYSRLGLKTTMLVLPPMTNVVDLPCNVRIQRTERLEAVKRWRQWQLCEVEHHAGHNGVQVAIALIEAFDWYMESLPRGEYLTIYQGDQEIGFAFVHRQADGVELGLFPSPAFWTGKQTAALITAVACHLGASIHRLRIAVTHADALESSATFDFKRHREQERYYVYKEI